MEQLHKYRGSDGDMPPVYVDRNARGAMNMELREDGSLLVRAPYNAPPEKIDAFLHSHRVWIRRRVQRLQELWEAEKHPLTEQDIRKLAEQASRELPPRLEEYARQAGVSYGRVTIRNQKTLWGSCSSRGNLNFNCLLMLTPREVQDYVLVHELCHRKVMDHSPRFWAEVEKILPDYKKRKAWLRKNGDTVIRRMTARAK